MSIAMIKALGTAIEDAGWDRAPARDPDSVAAYLDLLTTLYAAGRRDLPLGRLLEGHVDAVQTVLRYASPDQALVLTDAVHGGARLGVWNAALAEGPLVASDTALSGGKSYASGAGVLTYALVTAQTPAGVQLLLVDLVACPPSIDRNWWRVIGMQRSETHQVRWADAAIDGAARIGAPGSYGGEPWFSGGALRFVAVHAGGVAGLFDRTRDHLIATGRADDPVQTARLAELLGLADTAANAVRRTVELWSLDDAAAHIARVAAARMTVTRAAEAAMTLAQQAVGLQGMFVDHPLAANLADLAVYLRQPAPDAARARVGRAAVEGVLVPAL